MNSPVKYHREEERGRVGVEKEEVMGEGTGRIEGERVMSSGGRVKEGVKEVKWGEG